VGGIARADHRVEVGDGLTTAVTVIAAPEATPLERPIAVFAFPGGGYGRRYFDLQLDAHEAAGRYSQAEHHAERGLVVVACDHLGCGESDGAPGLTLARIAAANTATAAEMRRRLASGQAAPGLAPIRDPLAIGIGQSMGGCFTIAAQGRHRCFDAIAILGYSAHHTVVPVPPGVAPGTFSLDVVRYAWHWDDVPEAVVDRDVAGYPVPLDGAPLPPWRSVQAVISASINRDWRTGLTSQASKSASGPDGRGAVRRSTELRMMTTASRRRWASWSGRAC